MLLAGTRTFSRMISANPGWPLILRIGLRVTPGAVSGNTIRLVPLCRSLPGSRNRPNAQSAKAARLDQITEGVGYEIVELLGRPRGKHDPSHELLRLVVGLPRLGIGVKETTLLVRHGEGKLG